MPKQKRITASKKDAVSTISKKKGGDSAEKKARLEEENASKYFSNSEAFSGDVQSASSDKKPSDSKRLPSSFYNIPCEDLAKALLGQKLVHIVNSKRLTGVIVETEAYLGPIDKGAHSYEGKRTAKNEAMYMPPGTAYVYNIYGTYCCMNISAKGKLKLCRLYELFLEKSCLLSASTSDVSLRSTCVSVNYDGSYQIFSMDIKGSTEASEQGRF